MSNNSKTKPAFPGRTGMGYENGLSKLEYVAALLYSGNNEHCNLEQAVERAAQLLKLCEAAEKAGK